MAIATEKNMSENDKICFAFYSARAVAAGNGTSFYRLMDGREVEATAIMADEAGADYLLSDKVCLGMTTRNRWVRKGQASRMINKRKEE